jgi:2-oxo-3-hexenedioate decarboxylase
MNDSRIAEQILAASDGGAQLPPITDADPAFDVARAYAVLRDLHERRKARGWRAIGRKIGFTNRTLWQRYGVDRPMWSHVWDRTVQFAPDGRATLALAGLHEPRIEPEVVFGLAAPLPPTTDAAALLAAVEWMAAGFEIVHSVFPGWKFRVPDCTAAFGLHGALVVGAPTPIARANREALASMMPTFVATLSRDGTVVETGVGANVLGGPVDALAYLRDVLAADPAMPALAAGEIVTTGTLTDAWPVAAGQSWTCDYGTLGLRATTLMFR